MVTAANTQSKSQGLELQVMFQDESRFGRINDIKTSVGVLYFNNQVGSRFKPDGFDNFTEFGIRICQFLSQIRVIYKNLIFWQ